MKRLAVFFLTLFVSVNAIHATVINNIEYILSMANRTAIVDSYFRNNLGKVVIPEEVMFEGYTFTVIGINDYAFKDCSSLTSVTIPNTVKSIGKDAFRQCSSLTSVTIGNSVTSIGDYAFQGCSSLTSVTIGESVTSIGTRAFYSCSSLTSVTIPNSVTKIWGEAFIECTSLTKVYIDSHVILNNHGEVDNTNYFYSSAWSMSQIFGSQVAEYIIGEGVKRIGDYAFYGCSKLTSFTIPESLTHIGEYAFYGCSRFTSITIPKMVTFIGDAAFSTCWNLTNVTLNSNTIACKEYTAEWNLSHIFGSQVSNYVIGDEVTHIGSYAFCSCEFLTSVTIGENVTSIGNAAFLNCSSLSSMVVESGNTNYDSRENCNAIIETATNTLIAGCQNTIIPSSVMSIGNSAFYRRSSLKSITIPNSVTSIGESAFSGCTSLTKTNYTGDIAGWCNIKFSNGGANPIYYSHNFYINDQKIKDLVIPNTVDSIHDYAFSGCSSLTSITIPNSITSIGKYAFYDCTALTSITIPNSVTSIGESAFEECSRLTSVTIGNGVTSIGEYAFYNCAALTYITIPNSVTSIGAGAFLFCSGLTSVTIPNSVTSIGNWAFSYCISLTTLVCKATEIPNTAVNAFDDSNIVTEDGPTLYATLYVPKASLDKYKSTAPWSYFKKILPIEDSSEDPSNPDDEETDRAITCAEAVSICQETGTTITTEQYTIRGYVTYITSAYSEQYNNITFWMADIPNGGKVLQAYRVIPVEANDIDVKVGDYVEVIGSLVNYYGTTPEVYMGGTYTIDCESNDTPKDDEEDDGVITCAEAVSICQETGTTITTEQYTIRGYVTYITSAYSEQYNNITFWMADIPNGGKVLQAYRVIPVEANDIDVKVGDYVEVVGSLVNYYGTTPEVYMGGTYTIIPEGVSTDINNIKVPTNGSSIKFLRDGQFLILRDGKTYNAQGAVIK